MRIYKVLSLLLFVATISMSAQKIKEYKVREGETLKDIADKFDVNYIELLRINRKIARKPKANTIIKIPGNRFVKYKRAIDLRSQEPSRGEFVLHTVKPKETLYSLSKNYKVSMSDLIKNNVFLAEEGLIIGQELKIPEVLSFKSKYETNHYHVTEPKETLFSIAKKHEISLTDLKENNVNILSNGLTIGDTLVLPKKDTNLNSVKGNEHLVAEGETAYAIARKYGISVAEFLEVNKGLDINDLMIGAIVKLPNKVLKKNPTSTGNVISKQEPIKYHYTQGEDVDVLLEKFKISKDSLRSINPSLDGVLSDGGELLLGFKKSSVLFENGIAFKDSIVTDREINAVLMLPFNLKKNDSLSSTTLFYKSSSLPSMVADFYLGAEMAVDSLKKQGVNLNLKIVDTEKKTESIGEKIGEIKAYNPDVIIGPLFSSNAMFVARSFPETPVYYPIYSKKQKDLTAKNIIKTAANKDLFEKEIISYIRENRKGEHLIIVGLDKNVLKLRDIKSQCVKNDNVGRSIDNDVTILSLPKEYVAQEEFIKTVKLEKDNWILIAENKNNVIDAGVFNNILTIPKDSIKETPIKILSFEKSKYATDEISYENLAKYRYTYPTDQLEYDNNINDDVFEAKFLDKNKAYPSDFAARGFSVTYDAVLRALKEGAIDKYKASKRYKQAYYYDKADGVKNENQAVFINSIENTEEKGLKIIRLR